MFKFLLVVEDGELHDPAAFLTVVPNYTVGEEFLLGDGKRLRILEIDTNLHDDLVAEGFNGVFTVEPV